MRKLYILTIAILLAGCASLGIGTGDSGLAVTGEGLKALGEEFVAVSAVYVQGCNSGQIKPDNCAKYRSFGQKFQKSYPLAIQLWEAARKANDAAVEKKMREVVTLMATELSSMAVNAYVVFTEETK
jgi:hypothetical protein